MAKRTRLSTVHFRPAAPGEPAIKPIAAWPSANPGFYDDFRAWLKAGGYGESALDLYSVAARLALGLLDKPYWQIDPEADLDRVRAYLAAHYDSQGTRSTYEKGLAKLAEYLAHRNRQPRPDKPINWAYYTAGLPADWVELLRNFIAHCRRRWQPEQRYRATLDTLSHLTGSLRWLAANTGITRLAEITPARWFEYVDARLALKIKPVTLNSELHHLHSFLRFLIQAGQPVDTRLLRLEPLAQSTTLPRDVSPDHLRRVLAQIEAQAATDHAGRRRMGLMDKAWFLLMLHSGLRTGEVRRLKQADLDLPDQRVRIEQSKGLKDRVVFLSQPTVKALGDYLAVRSAANTDHVFLFRHQPLGTVYCLNRLKTYGRRYDVIITPHQLIEKPRRSVDPGLTGCW